MNFNKEGNLLELNLKENVDGNFNYKNKNIVIRTIDNKESNPLTKLPYSKIEKIIRIDFSEFDKEEYFDIDIICNNDEFVFTVQELYFKTLNESTFKNHELTNGLTDRIQLLTHNVKEGENAAKVNKSDIKYLLNNTQDDMKIIGNLFENTKENIKNLQRHILLIVNKFESKNNSETDNIGLFRIESRDGKIQKFNEKLSGIKENKPDKPPIVIIHGLASSIGVAYYDLINHLSNKYIVYCFDYYTINQQINYSGKLLSDYIRILSDKHDKVKIPIIAHSMGGVVSRTALVHYGASIEFIVMAGTPNNGCSTLTLTKLCRKVLKSANVSTIKRKDFDDLVLGNNIGLQDLSNKTKFISQLNRADTLNNQKQYFTLAGTMVLYNSDGLVRVKNMTRINNFSMPHILNNKWCHLNYFKKGLFENQVDKAIKYLYI